ncbi:MAG: hypothetical protein WD844_01385 [Thermoleophilaceae bacterium]
MFADDRVRIRRQPLSDDVKLARCRQDEADGANESLVTSRIRVHLEVTQAVLDSLREDHQLLVEETDFEPLQKTRQGAAWLIAGRCISLGYAVVLCVRAGLTTDIAPLARMLHEATGALRIMLDREETDLHRKWLRDGYFAPKELQKAQKRMEDRATADMLRHGVLPPGRTNDLDRQLYGHWSRIAHNRRSGIIESYRPDLRRFVAGPHSDALSRAVWAGYGTQVLYELTVTVGAALAKMLGPGLWVARIEPATTALDQIQRDHPLDPASLGFGDHGD